MRARCSAFSESKPFSSSLSSSSIPLFFFCFPSVVLAEVDVDSFIFGLKGMPEIRLVLKEKQEFDKVILGAASSKLDFTLSAIINEMSENSCEAQLLFNGDFNPMMAMMVKSPLQKFIDVLTENASKL